MKILFVCLVLFGVALGILVTKEPSGELVNGAEWRLISPACPGDGDCGAWFQAPENMTRGAGIKWDIPIEKITYSNGSISCWSRGDAIVPENYAGSTVGGFVHVAITCL